MRLSDVWKATTKTIYPNHRLPPPLTEVTTGRSNRLLGDRGNGMQTSDGLAT
jgi:hypothetical protein